MLTAEEILVKINDIMVDGVDVGDRILETIEVYTRDVRRQALLDAAKAVCPYCHVNRQFGKGIWSKYHVFDDGSRQPCCAEHIHAFIAQLDAEAKPEVTDGG